MQCCLVCNSENVTVQGEVIAHEIVNGEVVHKILHAVECLDCAAVHNVAPEAPVPEVPPEIVGKRLRRENTRDQVYRELDATS